MENDIESTQDVRKASEARRWAVTIVAESGVNVGYMLTVALVTEYIRKKREQGCQRPLKPVLAWIIDYSVNKYTQNKSFGEIERVIIRESGKKKEGIHNA